MSSRRRWVVGVLSFLGLAAAAPAKALSPPSIRGMTPKVEESFTGDVRIATDMGVRPGPNGSCEVYTTYAKLRFKNGKVVGIINEA